jgi:hypothetical protein
MTGDPSYLTKYDHMPIPADMARTKLIAVGEFEFGIQFRELRDDTVAEQKLERASGDTRGKVENLDDVGVAIHVFYTDVDRCVEVLRFDCFHDEPHYHYVNWDTKRNDIVWLDPTAMGDCLQWSLQTIATRLQPMVDHALGAGHGLEIDQQELDKKLPQIAAAAYAAASGQYLDRENKQ